MQESLSGGTTNLLRMARSGCQSAVAFVALALDDQSFATAVYPASADEQYLSGNEVDDVVRQLWLDPGLGRGKALVRPVRLGGSAPERSTTRVAVAAVPLGVMSAGQPWGILGVADPDTKAFGLPELELLSRIAQRLASYVRARHEVRLQLAATRGARPAPASGSEPSTQEPPAQEASGSQWWSIEAARSHQAADDLDIPPPPATYTLAPPRPPTLRSAPRRESEHDAASSAAASASSGAASASPAAASAATPEVPLASVPFPSMPPFPPPAGTTGPHGAGPRATWRDHGASARSPLLPGVMSAPANPETADLSSSVGSLWALLDREETSIGLLPLGALLARAGRMLGAGATASGALAVVAMEIDGARDLPRAMLADVARALREVLRFDDPVSRVGPTSLVAVVPLLPGGASGEILEARLAANVQSSVSLHGDYVVRTSHVVAEMRSGHDADDLVRTAVGKLRAQ